jgi:hypothetical protein
MRQLSLIHLPPRRPSRESQLEERFHHLQDGVDELAELQSWLFIHPVVTRASTIAFAFGAMWMMGASVADMGGTLDWKGPHGELVQTPLGQAPLFAVDDPARGN